MAGAVHERETEVAVFDGAVRFVGVPGTLPGVAFALREFMATSKPAVTRSDTSMIPAQATTDFIVPVA